MAETQTLYVSFRKLHNSAHGAIILRLMMAFNDISLANHGLAQYKQEQPRLRKHVQMGARLYFLRLQCGHMNEAMRVIREIRDDAALQAEVDKCSSEARAAFGKLTSCLDSNPGATDFGRYIGAIRNKTAFHYDPSMVLAALNDRARRAEAATSTITAADELSLWRFEAADYIIDSIVVRQLWKIPRTSDLRAEADRIADYGSDICLSFLIFSSEFTFRYMAKHAPM
jgi:hypothetical protein